MATNFNKDLGQRLKKARKKLNLSLQEVAKNMGFKHYQTVSSIEEATRNVSASELAKFTKLYLTNIGYFLDTKKESEKVCISWRNKANDSKTKMIEQLFLKYCENYGDLEERLGMNNKVSLPVQNNLLPDDFNIAKVNSMANEYNRTLQLGSRPACVLRNILEQKYNIKIVYMNLGNLASGASARGSFGTVILLNSDETPWRRNFNIAHELFHVITSRIFEDHDIHINCDEKSPIEKWADMFASSLLLPEEAVVEEFKGRIKDDKISLIDIIGIAHEFEVSTSALLWRLVNLDLLRKSDVQEIIDDPGFKKIDRDQRKSIKRVESPRISERYINLAFKAYQKGLISRGKLAEYLNIDRSEVASRLLDYGYNEEEIYEQVLTPA